MVRPTGGHLAGILRVGRIAVAAWLAAGILVASASPAAASGPRIAVTPSQPVPGQQVTIRGAGFCAAPCSPISVTVDGSVAAGNVLVATDGTFDVQVTLAPVAGTTTVAVSQTDAGGTARAAMASIRVVAADQAVEPQQTSPATTSTPAQSGEQVWLGTMVAVAALAVIMIAIAVPIVRRR